MRTVIKNSILGVIGGAVYVCLEMIWRGHSHWTMFLLGAVCFMYSGIQNEYTSWDKPLLLQSVQTAVFITVNEFFAGMIINRWLGWNVWDYSNQPFNICGQICLPFSILWVLVGTAAIILDDYLRYWIFGEEKPHYKLL